MKVLSREQLLLLHSQLINPALNAPFQGFGDYEFYPTVTDKAVRLGYGLIENHPFHDGNKRIGALAMLTLLDLNNIQLEATNLELEQIILDVAAGTIDYKAFHAWVLAHI